MRLSVLAGISAGRFQLRTNYQDDRRRDDGDDENAGAFSKQLREPVQSSVSVKGNRMVHLSKDHAQIIDLDSETITEVNFPKKQYSVMTFAEMTQAMERAMHRAQDKKAESKPAEGKPSDTTTDFKVDVKETGQTKQIAGYTARK